MARALLDANGVRELEAALIEAYRSHRELRSRHPMAKWISRPGVPALLSESLLALCASTLLAPARATRPGPRGVDLEVELVQGGSMLVEVKACGAQRWQEIKPRDLEGDALVWVDFGSRHEEGDGPIEVHVLPQPGRCVGRMRGKPGLVQFLTAVDGMEGFRTFLFADVEAMIDASALPGAPPHRMSKLFDA